MFLFFSLLAASIDGFICGFITGASGVKFTYKDFFNSLAVIFLCCVTAAFAGRQIALTTVSKYIDLLGVVVMLVLAMSAFRSAWINENMPQSGVLTLAFSVAMDASAVCLYLAMDGYNVLLVSAMSAVMHSVLMAVAAHISNRIIKDRWEVYTRYLAGIIFLAMAVYKYFHL